MKTNKQLLLILIAVLCITISCKKDNDMVPGQILNNSYNGTLSVKNVNTYPEWDESAQVNVEIDKEFGLVTFSSTTLNYSGETIINDDSKIVRTGSWEIVPSGILKEDNNTIYIEVDAGISVVNDIQKIYAKNNEGLWELVNETNFDSQPNSDMVFDLNDAATSGSVVSADSGTASLTWTLRLTVALD